MNRTESSFPRRERLEMRLGFMLRRRVLAGIVAMLMGASLVFSGSASAHNIDLAKARDLARNYARSIRDESGGKYLHYTTNCVRNFPGHNHSVRCVIEYQNAKDTAAGVYTCKETIELFMPAHTSNGGMAYDIYGRHTSRNRCGSHDLGGGTLMS
jgi:hypothetical protein